MARHIYSSAHDWLNSRINALEAGEDAKELASLFRSLLAGGSIDNDAIQDVFQSDMDNDGFFYDFEEDPIKDANPEEHRWSIADCQWFLNYRLGIDPNTVDTVEDEDIEGWHAYVLNRIDDYEQENDD